MFVKFFLPVLSCRLLITFANSLETDQAQQFVGPDLDPNCLTLLVFLKYFLKKKERIIMNFKKSADDNYPVFKLLKVH